MQLPGFQNYINEDRSTYGEFTQAVRKAGGIGKLSTKSLEHYMRGRKKNDRVYVDCLAELLRRRIVKRRRSLALKQALGNKVKKTLPTKTRDKKNDQWTHVKLGRDEWDEPFHEEKSDKGRMFCYMYSDEQSKNPRCKFGERFVKAGLDPVQDCLERIREQRPVDTALIASRQYRIRGIWDVSEWAEKVGRNEGGKHMDTFITRHPEAGFPKPFKTTHGSPSEWFYIDWETPKKGVDDLLRKKMGPPKTAMLSTWQGYQLENALEAIERGRVDENGERVGDATILADLCPRFGKTLWASSIALETKTPLTVVASYVLPALHSFADQIPEYKQFRDFEIIWADEDDYKKKMDEGLENGKQVMVLLSLSPGEKRAERVENLLGKKSPDVKKLLVVDEADFGAHRFSQASMLQDARDDDTTVVLMTGSNPARALGKMYEFDDETISAQWHPDKILSTVYAELEAIAQDGKKDESALDVSFKYAKEMNKVNKDWSKGVVPMVAVQLPLDEFVEEQKKRMKAANNSDKYEYSFIAEYNPDEDAQWSKFGEEPRKGAVMFKQLVGVVFGNEGGQVPYLNMDSVVESINRDAVSQKIVNRGLKRNSPIRAMMFLPACRTRKRAGEAISPFHDIAKMLLEKLGTEKWRVIAISGEDSDEIEVNGEKFSFSKTSGKEVETDVKLDLNNPVFKDKNVIVVTRGPLGTRSFSVPDITESHLLFDGGDAGVTAQKISRTFTADPDMPNKVGLVVNWSLNPNRDDKFDSYHMKAAQNITQYQGGTFISNYRRVTRTNDFLISQKNGSILKVTADMRTKELVENNRVHKVIGKLSSIEDAKIKFGDKTVENILNWKLSSIKQEKQKNVAGKKYVNVLKRMRGQKFNKTASDEERMEWQKRIESAAHALKHVIPYVEKVTGKKHNLKKAVDIAYSNVKIRSDLSHRIGYDFKKVYQLYMSGIINNDFAQIYEGQK